MRRSRMPYRRKKAIQYVVLFEICVEHLFAKSDYKTPFKIKKQIWYDELSDSDMFTPSCPHLHSIDGKYKLNVYTGELYNIRQKRIVRDRRVPEKELKKLWKDHEFVEFAKKMRSMYFEKFPESKLDDIPEFS